MCSRYMYMYIHLCFFCAVLCSMCVCIEGECICLTNENHNDITPNLLYHTADVLYWYPIGTVLVLHGTCTL